MHRNDRMSQEPPIGMTKRGTVAKSKKRKRGRPPHSKLAGLVTRETILDNAYERSRTISFDELSFVKLADEFGVVAGSLHYHIGTKDDLQTALLNRFYRDLFSELETSILKGRWQSNLRSLASTFVRHLRQHLGAARHIQTKARYRLFQ